VGLEQDTANTLILSRPVWVSWEPFLDSIAEDMVKEDDSPNPTSTSNASDHQEGDVTPTAEKIEQDTRRPSLGKSRSVVHDAVVEVIISPHLATKTYTSAKEAALKHITAKMIITVWELQDDRFFTLTFTSTDHSVTKDTLTSPQNTTKRLVRSTVHSKASSIWLRGGSSGSNSGNSPSSITSSQSSIHESSNRSSAITSHTEVSMSTSHFPPMGPPHRQSSMTSAPSSLQKIITMKDALLDNTEVPILAMWKDESIAIPNRGQPTYFFYSKGISYANNNRL
jgi:hypothetical protein